MHDASAPGTANVDPDAALIDLGHFLIKAGYRFTTVSPATHARVNARKGNERAADLQGIFGWSRPFDLALLPAEAARLMRDAGVLVPDGPAYRSLVRASTLGGQLFFHSAYPTDDTDAVFFGPDTYRFASAIERHLERRSTPVRRAIDIGCGGAPGAVSIAASRPEADVLATDINAKALRFAKINAALAGAAKVRVRASDLLKDVDGTFDLIVANPPYLMDSGRRTYRHGGGELGEGLSLAIVDAAMQRLNPGGSLLLYTGVAMANGADPFLHALKERFDRAPVRWEYREIDPDVFGEELESDAYADVDRIAAVVLVAHK